MRAPSSELALEQFAIGLGFESYGHLYKAAPHCRAVVRPSESGSARKAPETPVAKMDASTQGGWNLTSSIVIFSLSMLSLWISAKSGVPWHVAMLGVAIVVIAVLLLPIALVFALPIMLLVILLAAFKVAFGILF